MSEIYETKTAYCGKCLKTRTCLGTNCSVCHKPVWELLASKCSNTKMRTTNAIYARLVRAARFTKTTPIESAPAIIIEEIHTAPAHVEPLAPVAPVATIERSKRIESSERVERVLKSLEAKMLALAPKPCAALPQINHFVPELPVPVPSVPVVPPVPFVDPLARFLPAKYRQVESFVVQCIPHEFADPFARALPARYRNA